MEKQLIQIDSKASIKAYFRLVYQLAQQGDKFPIPLDEVWPMVYADKAKSVRALRRDFIEGIDFRLLAPNGEQKNKQGGHNQIVYQLSPSCFEFFIARKVRPVFEVYRHFFHRAVVDATALIPNDQLLQQEQRLADLEHQIRHMQEAQQQAARSLLELPRSTEALPEETTRIKIQRLVNGYCGAKGVGQQEVWRLIYDRLFYLYRISIRAHKRSERESWLDVAERKGYLDKLYAIASTELYPNQG